MARPIVFLSDFGLADEFVGVCHGIIARIAPGARVIDLTHAIPPQDIVRGALLLADSAPFMPSDTIFLAVVDPGVGTDRREIAVAAGSGATLVGPDNGLLSLAWERLGGAKGAVHISSGDVVAAAPSATFHGRDIFAPAAAHLANGATLEDLGLDVEVDSLARIRLAEPVVGAGSIHAEVLDVDRFGNVELNVRRHHLRDAGLEGTDSVRVITNEPDPRSVVVRWATTFGGLDEGEYGAVVDSRGRLAIVLNGASAGESLALAAGDPVVIQSVG